MKALTLYQPWAGLVAIGTKTIETRSWSTKYRGPLAIHGGADERPSRTFEAQLIVTHWPQDRWDRMLFGHVVAMCELIDVIPMVEGLPPQPWSDPWAVMTVDPWPIIHRWPGFGSADGRGHAEEKPYGDYRPGRFAWILDKIEPLAEPVPAKGRQGLWEWSEA